MTGLMKVRVQIRKFLSPHSNLINKILAGFMTFISLYFVISAYPYNKTLSNPAIIIVISILCAFAPYSACTLIVVAYLMIELLSLSLEIAGAALLFIILAYIVAGSYRSRMVPAFALEPVSYRINAPFILPMLTALFGKKRDCSAVIMSGILTYFFSAIYKNSALITDEKNPISSIDLITREMISAPMFYVFIIAIIVMFLVTYLLRSLPLENGFILGVLFGVLAEFSIMLLGCFIFSARSDIPVLIISNIVTLAIGIVSVFIFRDFDYSRVERTRFDDDDYYYYVTAVPKIKLSNEETVIKDITGSKKERTRRHSENLKEKDSEDEDMLDNDAKVEDLGDRDL